MNVLNLMRFLFAVAFLAPIIRYLHREFVDGLIETLMNKIRSIRGGRQSNKTENQNNNNNNNEQF